MVIEISVSRLTIEKHGVSPVGRTVRYHWLASLDTVHKLIFILDGRDQSREEEPPSFHLG